MPLIIIPKPFIAISVIAAATPTFTPVAGTYVGSQTVTIGSATPLSTIYYTTDGSAPTFPITGTTQQYTAPITVSSSETINAIAVATGYYQSSQASAAYVIEVPAATPTFSPAGGTYSSTQTVSIFCSTPSPTIYFTIDGSTPTTGSSVYSTPIAVSASETIKAIATAPGYLQSAVGSAAYTISAAPVIPGTQLNFNSGIYCVSPSNEGFGSNNYQAEITAFAAKPVSGGFYIQLNWQDFAGSSPGAIVTTAFDTQYAYLQSKVPGCRCGIVFTSYSHNGNLSLANLNAGSFHAKLPSYLLNATSGQVTVNGTLYNLVAQPTSPATYGWFPCDWQANGSNWDVYAYPAWFDTGVMAAWGVDMVALINHAESVAGNLFDGWINNDEYSANYGSAYQTTPTGWGGTPAPPGGSSTAAAARAGLQGAYTYIQANTTSVYGGTCDSFGYGGSDGVSHNPPSQWCGPTGFLSNYVRGQVLCNSDCFGESFTGAGNWMVFAQQGEIGIGSPANGTTTPLPPVTTTVFTGDIDIWCQIQPLDLSTKLGSGIAINSAAAVAACMNTASLFKATKLLVWMEDGTGSNPGPWTSYIQAALLANASTYPLSGLICTKDMYGPSITSVTNVTKTSQTLGWAAITGQGTGLSLLLFRNGTQIASVNPASVTSFNDTGLTAGTAYTYTLKMSNANGTGPAGLAMVANTPVFAYPAGFAGQTGSFHTANNAGFNGSNMQFAGTGHVAGGVYYNTIQPTTNFTTQFSFYVNGLGSTPQTSGIAFVIQNTVSPPGNAAGVGNGFTADANECGYGSGFQTNGSQFPPYGSIGVKFDAGPTPFTFYLPGNTLSTTGLYTNGGPTTAGTTIGMVPLQDMTIYGLNVYSQDTFNVVMVYDGSHLTMTITDTTTNAQGRWVWPLNLAASTNATHNWLGFTGGKPSVASAWEITNWTYAAGYNTRLATPTMSPAPGQYSGTQTVTLSYPAGSTCYYTTNGLLPTSSSTLYSGPISVAANEVIQAVAIQTGYTDSLVASGNYLIGTANTINYPSGFSTGALIPVGYAYQSGSAYYVNDANQSQQPNGSCGAVWARLPVAVSTFSTTFKLQWPGGNGQGMCFVLQNAQAAAVPLSGVVIGTGGAITFSASASPIAVGQYLTVAGTNAGGGSLGGYANPTQYFISATNGSTSATLQTPSGQLSGNAITSTAGTPTGLTFSLNQCTSTGGFAALGAGGVAIGYGGMNAYNNTTTGYGLGLPNSIAVVFNCVSNGGGDPTNGVGIYTNGATPYGAQIATGLNFGGGSVFTMALTYSGTSLTININSGAFTHTWTGVNIPSIVGASTAIAGFTGGAYSNTAIEAITAWTM